MKRFLQRLMIVVALAWGGLFAQAPAARAESVADAFISRMNNNLEELTKKYGTGQKETVWATYQAIWKASGGPISSSLGLNVGSIMNRATWMWFLLFSALISVHGIQVWNAIGAGQMPYNNIFLVGLKMFAGILLWKGPDMVYATMMTIKDAGTIIASYAFRNQGEGAEEGDPRYALERAIVNTRVMNFDFQNIPRVMQEAIIEAYQERGMALANQGTPAVIQIYNMLAKDANSAYGGKPGFQPFPIVPLKRVKVTPAPQGEDGKPTGEPSTEVVSAEEFDGTLISAANATASSAPLSAAGASDAKSGETAFQYTDENLSAMRNVVTEKLPNLIAYMAIHGTEGDFAGSKFYPFVKNLRNPDSEFSKAWNEVMEAQGWAQKEDKKGISDIERLNMDQDRGIIALKKLAAAVKKETHAFLDFSIVQQYQAHNDPGVRDYYKRLKEQGLDVPLKIGVKMPGTAGGDALEKVAKFVGGTIGNIVRKIVIWINDKLFGAMVEFYIAVIWISFPFLLLEQTRRAFTGAFNTLVTLAVVPPFFSFMLVVGDLVVSNLASMLIGGVADAAAEKIPGGIPGISWAAKEFVGVVGAYTMAPAVIAFVAVANILVPILVLIAAPKVAKAFFAGDNVISEAKKPFVAAAATAGVAAVTVAAPGAKMAASGFMMAASAANNAARGAVESAADGGQSKGGAAGAVGRAASGALRASDRAGQVAGKVKEAGTGALRGAATRVSAVANGPRRFLGLDSPPASGVTATPSAPSAEQPTGVLGNEATGTAASVEQAPPPASAPGTPATTAGAPTAYEQAAAAETARQAATPGQEPPQLRQVSAASTKNLDRQAAYRAAQQRRWANIKGQGAAVLGNASKAAIAGLVSGGDVKAMLQARAGMMVAEKMMPGGVLAHLKRTTKVATGGHLEEEPRHVGTEPITAPRVAK